MTANRKHFNQRSIRFQKSKINQSFTSIRYRKQNNLVVQVSVDRKPMLRLSCCARQTERKREREWRERGRVKEKTCSELDKERWSPLRGALSIPHGRRTCQLTNLLAFLNASLLFERLLTEICPLHFTQHEDFSCTPHPLCSESGWRPLRDL